MVRLDDGRAVGFDMKDYAHIDHGYAATVHKAQGVTVDRAHVLATSHMDRHAAYVGLTPAPGAGGPALERGRVGQPGAADPGARPRAAEGHQPGLRTRAERRRNRRFGRESAANSVRAYAERRGLVPESEIVLREQPAETQRAEPARPRRGMFAGLKLEAGPGLAQAGTAPGRPPASDGTQDREATGWCRRWATTRGPGRIPSGCAGRAAGAAAPDRGAGAGRPRARDAAPRLRAGSPRGAHPCAAAGAGGRHGYGAGRADRGRAAGACRTRKAGSTGARGGAGVDQAGAGVRAGRGKYDTGHSGRSAGAWSGSPRT